MDKNDITRLLKSAKIPTIPEKNLPPISEQRKFIQTQIDEVKKVLFRNQFELAVAKEHLINEDVNIQRAGEQTVLKIAAEMRSYEITLRALKKVLFELPEDETKSEDTSEDSSSTAV